MCNSESELTPCSHKDMDIDNQHDHQRYQHTAKEIEIDHVVQGNDSFKQALRHAYRTSAAAGSGVATCAAKAGVIYFQIYLLIISFNNKFFQ